MRFRFSQRTGIVRLSIENTCKCNILMEFLFFQCCSVDIMSKKLDPECLGIILLNAFMDEFFPEEKRSVPDTFDLLHYNGMPGSNLDNKVQYFPLFMHRIRYHLQ